MTEPLEQAVIQAATHVLETAAFLSVWPWSESDGDLPAPDVAARMTFKGPCRGTLSLELSSALLPVLAENMLGEDASGEAALETGRDALKELLNMICGNLLTSWQGEDPVFTLSPPELPAEMATSGMAVPFCVEQTLARVGVELESEA